MSSKADSGSRPCVYCRKQPAAAPFRPFCSEGCRSRDLNAWLSDAYVIPGKTGEDELSDVSALDNGEEAG
ncbi:DNA gyrase inhibitor YacG [Sandarakinorhabdus sp.]|uniref:DNA gyrase inhibitor YacG n=1 Tax=Sandarakinorhabdus sp. TaxID=1916663 RepID=UPI003F72FA5C